MSYVFGEVVNFSIGSRNEMNVDQLEGVRCEEKLAEEGESQS
jgi:hypothetical protein